MFTVKSPSKQATILLALALFFSIAVIALIGIISVVQDEELSFYTMDYAAIVELSPLYGILSNFGMILWSSTAAICLFTFMLEKTLLGVGWGGFKQFFLGMGLLTGVLLLDDLFLVHEHISYKFENSKLIQLSFFAIYGLVLAGSLLIFWREILETDYWILGAALFFFALSIGIDLLPDTSLPGFYLWEDGAKFIGITCWAAYFWLTSYSRLKANFRPAETVTP